MLTKIECMVCLKEITKGDKILAFDEFTPSDYDWENIGDMDGFDEVIPDSGFWNLVHYYCIFKKRKS